MDWQEVCRDPLLQNLPFKIELNEWGRSRRDVAGSIPATTRSVVW